jgi:hypothetical protein
MQKLAEQAAEAANAIDLDEVLTRGTLAELIRRFAFDNYVVPVRGTPNAEIRIRAGDVHRDMKLSGRMPAVCGALDARVFGSDFGLELVRRTGPRPGANAEWVFRTRMPVSGLAQANFGAMGDSGAAVDKTICSACFGVGGVGAYAHRARTGDTGRAVAVVGDRRLPSRWRKTLGDRRLS